MVMGANEFTLEELQALFQEDSPEPQTDDDKDKTPSNDKPIVDDELTKRISTKAVADRIKEVRKEEQDKVAKEMGYESYDAMVKSKEDKLLKDKGYDPTELAPVVEELIKNRMDNDPRLKELETLRKAQVKEYAIKELAKITELTGGEITSIDQLPKEVLDAWAKEPSGSLKNAFLQTKGEHYILKARSAASKGQTDHLKNPTGPTPPSTKTRPLTAEEKIVWKQFHPKMTEEELSKKTMPI